MYHYSQNQNRDLFGSFNQKVGSIGSGNRVFNNYGMPTTQFVSGPNIIDQTTNTAVGSVGPMPGPMPNLPQHP